MKKFKSLIGLSAVLAILFLVGCESTNSVDAVSGQEPQNLVKTGRTTIWADCDLYGGVVTPATFDPDHGPFDEIYVADYTTFKDGVGAISESKPGDQDYNGGRWHVNVINQGVDPNKYLNACSDEDLDLSDFHSTSTYFECPLQPRHNQ